MCNVSLKRKTIIAIAVKDSKKKKRTKTENKTYGYGINFNSFLFTLVHNILQDKKKCDSIVRVYTCKKDGIEFKKFHLLDNSHWLVGWLAKVKTLIMTICFFSILVIHSLLCVSSYFSNDKEVTSGGRGVCLVSVYSAGKFIENWINARVKQ